MAKKGALTTSDYMKYEDYVSFVNQLNADKLYIWELYARLGFCTACRVSDILNLKWGDILDKPKTIVIEQKTMKPREIRFNESVMRKISELYVLLESPNKDNYIFRSRRSKERFSSQYVNRRLKGFKKEYNLPIENFSTHTFRKTFGRYVYELDNCSAESLMLLNKMLNHTSIAVTQAYIGLTKDRVSSVFDSIKF